MDESTNFIYAFSLLYYFIHSKLVPSTPSIAIESAFNITTVHDRPMQCSGDAWKVPLIRRRQQFKFKLTRICDDAACAVCVKHTRFGW